MAENPIFALNARVSALRAQGADIVALTAGEPQAATSERIVSAAQLAVADPSTHHYGSAAGDHGLRRSIVDTLPGGATDWNPDDVLVTLGAKHALVLAIQAVVEPGDEVIVVKPGWPGHSLAVRAAGAIPVTVGGDRDAHAEASVIAAAATPRTRAVIMASPANPTGAVLPAAALREIAEWAAEAGVWIISDDVYAAFDYSGTYAHLLEVAPEARERSLIVDSVSKEHAMTGWRIGWLAGPSHVVRRAEERLGATITNVPLALQRAAIAALADTEGPPAARECYRGRRDRLVAALQTLPGFDCESPAGGMFVFPSVRSILDDHGWDRSGLLVERLIDGGVAVVPGEAFGAPDRVRICYAVDDRTLDIAIGRIAAVIETMREELPCAL